MNKFLIITTIGIISFLCIAIFLYLEIKHPDFFNILQNLLTLLASLATIFAACFAVVTIQNFKNQKRIELLSKLSQEKIKTIDFIGQNLQLISTLINDVCKDIGDIKYRNSQFLSLKLQKIKENDKLTDICMNFEIEFESIIRLVSQNDQKIILETQKLLKDYISLLLSLDYIIKYYTSSIAGEREKLSNSIQLNITLFDQIHRNLITLKKILKNHSLYQ